MSTKFQRGFKGVCESIGAVLRILSALSTIAFFLLVILRATDEIEGGFWLITSPIWGWCILTAAVLVILLLVGSLHDMFAHHRRGKILATQYDAQQREKENAK